MKQGWIIIMTALYEAGKQYKNVLFLFLTYDGPSGFYPRKFCQHLTNYM